MRKLISVICAVLLLSGVFVTNAFSLTAESEENVGTENAEVTEKKTADENKKEESGNPAEEKEEEKDKENLSAPRFMVTGYKLTGESLTPGETCVLSVTFKNYSKEKALYNIKLTFSDPSGEILTAGMPTKYVDTVKAGGTFVWELTLNAVSTAEIGSHDVTVTAEYEDEYYASYSSGDDLRINVTQPVKLKYSGVALPKKSVQGDTAVVLYEIINAGKGEICNCSVDFSVEGLSSGGSEFLGNIAPSDSISGTANLKVDSSASGEKTGEAVITYEDPYGNEYTETVKLSTVIEKKKEVAESEKNTSKEDGNSLWWLFVIIGLVPGFFAGAFLLWLKYDRKQRREDDLRL